ncbi:MAG TPA: YihY/virulence factor BrkB family protein [Candidatus Saccharimonadales bacterium]|nr:YihY/virulence factor BrkB family protein [Candidatus Saccharimonadales bacterium]
MHKFIAFPYAVIKKYGEDSGGYMAALLTYYGFLSLFPLLLVAVSVLQLVLHSHPSIQSTVLQHATQYFPVVGNQLDTTVHARGGTGIALAIGILLTLWGAKGIADVFQNNLNLIWGIPKLHRPRFPKNGLKSLAIIILGGFGLVVAAFLSGFASNLDRLFIFRVLSILVSVSVLLGIFWLIFKLGLAYSNINKRALLRSAVIAAVGIQILQIIGGLLVTRELHNLKHLYGTFAVTLGLLFWIYLQARVFIYAAVAGVVYDKKLWPRSLVTNELTDADKRSIADQAKRERSIVPERIGVGFKGKQ